MLGGDPPYQPPHQQIRLDVPWNTEDLDIQTVFVLFRATNESPNQHLYVDDKHASSIFTFVCLLLFLAHLLAPSLQSVPLPPLAPAHPNGARAKPGNPNQDALLSSVQLTRLGKLHPDSELYGGCLIHPGPLCKLLLSVLFLETLPYRNSLFWVIPELCHYIILLILRLYLLISFCLILPNYQPVSNPPTVMLLHPNVRMIIEKLIIIGLP